MTTSTLESRPDRPIARALVSSIVLVAVMGLVPAQAQQTETVFSDTTTVSVVEVPVQVLVKGEPVRDLNADDFVLLDEGTRRTLSSFEVIDLKLPTGSRQARLEPSPSLAARRKFLFLFDLNFTRPRDVLLGGEAARTMVERMGPTDLVSIGCFSSRRGLQVVLNFTSDKTRALDVLDGFLYLMGDDQRAREDGTANAKRDPLRLSTAGWSASVAEVGRALAGEVSTAELEGVAAPTTDLASATGGAQGGSEGAAMGAFLRANILANMAAFGRQDIQNQEGSLVVRMADALADLARRTRGVSGQKHMVLFSAGFDEDLLSSNMFYREAVSGAGSWVLAAVDEGLAEMRRAGWAVHPVVPGAGNANPGKRSGLFHLAAETDGTLFENYGDLGDAMGRLEKETSVTYLLSFQPEDVPAEPQYRRIKVRLVDGPKGADLHHKDGYYAPGAAAAASASGNQWRIGSLLAGGGEIDQLGVGVVAIPVEISPDETRVAVLLDMPGQPLLDASGARAEADLFVYAFEEQGQVRDFLATRVDLDRARHGDELLSAGLRYAGELRLPPGTYRLRFGVHSPANGRMAVVTREMVVPAPDAGVPELYAPFFLVPDGRGVLLWASGGQGETAADEPPYPFQFGPARLNPSARLSLSAPEPIHIAVVGLRLGASSMTARVVGNDGVDVPVTLTVVGGIPASKGLPDLHLLKLETEGLATGSYSLELDLGDDGDPARAEFHIASS